MKRPLEVVRTPTDLLEHAQGEVARRLEDQFGDADERTTALETLQRIIADVRSALDGTADGSIGADGSRRSRPGPLAHRGAEPLFSALMLEVLEHARGLPSPVAALDVMTAIESIRSSHLGRSGRDLSESLRTPDAFQLLVDVAHDFRSPLTSILFLAETLRDGHSGTVTEVQRSQLGLMYSAALGLASIASDIMDLARGERDLIDPEPEPYALVEVYSSVERLVRPVVEEKALELRIVVPEIAQVRGHPHAVSRVLLNLTTNALKFTDAGVVEIGAILRPRGMIRFYVRDTGRGIPEQRHSELFQAFKKRIGPDAEGHFFSGSGVGLSIARRLVRAMGSDLFFETADHEGTHFWFDLPTSPPSRT